MLEGSKGEGRRIILLTFRILPFIILASSQRFGPFMLTKKCLFLSFLLLITLILIYRRILEKKRKNSWILLLLIFTFLLLFTFSLRSLISEMVSALFASSFVFWFSSDSGEGANSLPPLESSSSTESLNTYRALYAADFELSIYDRIRALENGQYYSIPPQTQGGEYEAIVRDHFDQAITVDHLRSAMDMEYEELRIWEKKALLQDRLFSLMVSESQIARIMEVSPFDNIRKEAFEFIDGEVEDLNGLRSPLERRQMDETLSTLLTSIRNDGRASPTYRSFYSHFINEEFRRLHGLPLP